MPEYRSLPRRRRLTTGLAVVALLVVVLAVWGLQRVAPQPTATPPSGQNDSTADSAAPMAQTPERIASIVPQPAAASEGSIAELDFREMPDGPAPTQWATGQPALSSHWEGDPSSDFSVRNGRLTNRPSIDGPTAAYFSTSDLGGPVTELGARFALEPRGNTRGSLALIVSEGTQPSIPQIIGPAPIHFVAVSDKWNLTVGRDGHTPLEVVAEGKFVQPLKEDNETAYEVSIEINGGRVILNLPDGTRQVINDRRIGRWTGTYATFELYSRQGRSDSIPGFEKLWARSAPRQQ